VVGDRFSELVDAGEECVDAQVWSWERRNLLRLDLKPVGERTNLTGEFGDCTESVTDFADLLADLADSIIDGADALRGVADPGVDFADSLLYHADAITDHTDITGNSAELRLHLVASLVDRADSLVKLCAGHIEGVEPLVQQRVRLIDCVNHREQLGLLLIGRIESLFEVDDLGTKHVDLIRFVGFLAEESHGPTRNLADYCEVMAGKETPNKILLEESEMPTQWYNIVADLPTPPPPALHPGTHQPAGPEDFAPLFPMALIEQEVSTERYIDIPGGVLDVYKLWRPSPLFRAKRLEAMLDTPARIYYKYEGVSPAGSHKPNTAVPQAYYNHQEGITKLTTETGAGQWGSALAFATAQYGMECEIWQVAASYKQKPHRKTMMEIWGATLHSSPSELTEFGRSLLAENPDHTGSLGIAISEAVAMCMEDPNARYALGSVLNHVLMHQTIIGEEALLQLAKVEEVPDVLVGCTGGGSNFGGLAFPFLREKLAGRMNPIIRCVEPAACPTLTKGEYRYDFGDSAGMTPLMKMHTLGHSFVPEPIHAGGLRYHGMAPLVSHVYNEGLVEAISIPQRECFAAALDFAKAEGIIPAPEPTHAIAAAVREALACKESGEEKVILTALCGHGHLDLASYEKYLSGDMVDYELPDEAIAEAMKSVPVIG
jgi:tryptophan synthase beta chain